MDLGNDLPEPAGKRKRQDDECDDEEDSKLVGLPHTNIDSNENDNGLEDFDEGEFEDDEDDNNGLIGANEYDEDDEIFPNHVAYDPEFIQIGRDLINIPEGAVTIIDQSGCSSKRVQTCRNNADELTKLPRVRREKACLLGNTGAGKSSLLNALLGLPGLAKAMAGGQSCTYVGTEYESPFPGQTKKLAAKVEYYGLEEIEEVLARLLRDYNAWNFQQQDDWSDDEKQELKQLSNTAFTTFRSLFCDKEEFESPRAAEEYLETCFEDQYGPRTTLARMSAYCRELLEEKEADEDDHIEYLDGDTQEEFLAQLDPLVSSNSRFDRPTLWPLVKKVRVGIEGPKILDYITLVDLPGLDDTNQVRANASYDMMRSCQSIWVVAKIDRAITEQMVDNLFTRFGKSYKMIIICTGIDANLDDDLAVYLESEGQSIGNHKELLERELHLRKLITSLAKKIGTGQAALDGRNKFKSMKRRQLTENARRKLVAELEAWKSELRDAEEELPGICQQRFELLVEARNHNATRRLCEEKSKNLSAGEQLQVFCVSNLHYMSLKGARFVNGPRLSPEMTGIPALRTFVLESAAPRVQRNLEDFISHRFTVFMKGLAMWAKSFSVEGSSELLTAIEASRNNIGGVLQVYHDNMLASNEIGVVKRLQDSKQKQLRVALSQLEKKKGWHWSTTRAFIRRYGNHTTSVAPKQCWNEQFLEGTIEVVDEQWPLFERGREQVAEAMKDDLIGLLCDVLKTVNEHPAHMVLPMDRVDEIFEAHLHGIKQAYATHHEELSMDLRNIKHDVKQERNTGYFTQAMRELYEQCQEDRGTGVKARTFAAFDAYLRVEDDRSPFAAVYSKLPAAVSKDVIAKCRPLFRKVESIFEDIYLQFDDMVDQKMDDESEADVREHIKAYLGEAEFEFEKIKADLASIKRRYE